jgi:hypothetical protein
MAWGCDTRDVAKGVEAEKVAVPQQTLPQETVRALPLRDYSLTQLMFRCGEHLTLIGDVSRYEPNRPRQYWLSPVEDMASAGSQAILIDGGETDRPALKTRLAVTVVVECRRVYYKVPAGSPLRHSEETLFREESRAASK